MIFRIIEKMGPQYRVVSQSDYNKEITLKIFNDLKEAEEFRLGCETWLANKFFFWDI